MILAAGLLWCAQALPAAQDPGPADPAPAESQTSESDRRAWLESLSPEELEKRRERLEMLKQLSTEQLEEMKRRRDAILRLRRLVWSDLEERERQRLLGLDEHERQRVLDRMVHDRLRQRHEKLADELGLGPEKLRGRPLRERLDPSNPWIAQVRAADVLRELETLHQQGWLGDQAVAWLRTAPLAEQAAVALDARKWRSLAMAREQGWFEQWQLDEHEQRTLAEMPSRDFQIAIDELRRGIPKQDVFSSFGPGAPPPLPGGPNHRMRGGMGGGKDGERQFRGRPDRLRDRNGERNGERPGGPPGGRRPRWRDKEGPPPPPPGQGGDGDGDNSGRRDGGRSF